MIILTINCGSSSLKYMLYDWEEKKELASGIVERVTLSGSFVKHKPAGGKKVEIERDCPTHKEALNLVFELLTDPKIGVIDSLDRINAVGHRVLHGGEKITASIKIDEKAIEFFKSIYELGPLHLPPNVTGIEAAMELLGDIPHIAVMDTAFHSSMPEVSYIYAVPYHWYEKYGVRKYGFHGTSHLYVSRRAAVILGKDLKDTNLVTCHIGNGVSLTAVRNGKSFDHSMGLTPLEGLVMGTRSGSIDSAVVQFICEKEDKKVSEVIDDLNHKSGLLGLSGKWSDRRDILREMAKGDKRAELAFGKEVHSLKQFIGAYIAILGRTDAVVFTAGAGERAFLLREAVCSDMEHIGIKLDREKNGNETGKREACISTEDSPIKILVIPTNEEIVFVEDVVGVLNGEYKSHETYNYSFSSPDYKRDD
jgi:acetate kinase